MKTRQISVGLSEEHYHHLKQMSAYSHLSLSALARDMIEKNLSGKRSFEEDVLDQFLDLSRRMGKMAYRLSRTEILLEEFLDAYLFYTPEIPRDFPGREAMENSGENRYRAILSIVQERLRNKAPALPDPEEKSGS